MICENHQSHLFVGSLGGPVAVLTGHAWAQRATPGKSRKGRSSGRTSKEGSIDFRRKIGTDYDTWQFQDKLEVPTMYIFYTCIIRSMILEVWDLPTIGLS